MNADLDAARATRDAYYAYLDAAHAADRADGSYHAYLDAERAYRAYLDAERDAEDTAEVTE